MLKELLEFLADELNNYLTLKENMSQTDPPRFVLGNVAKAFDNEASSSSPSTNSSSAASIVNSGILSIVNIEEDKAARQPENYVKTDTTARYKSPPLYINVYLLIALNRTSYTDSLKWLSYVLQFFQHQKVFTPVTHPSLDNRIQKIMVDLCSPTFEQVNHLWSTLGGKYLPSVLYKIRQVTIDEDLTTSEGGLIREIQLGEKLKMPVSG